jgi:hypothetical protein
VRGQRTSVTCVCFHPSGRQFALGTSCGSIQIWNHSRISSRPDQAVYEAHGDKNAITSLVFNVDGSQLGSRSFGDDTVKIWNAERLTRTSKPLAVCGNMESVHEQANLAFSPDSRKICAGASSTSQDGGKVGRLLFFDIAAAQGGSRSTSPIMSLEFEEKQTPVAVKWHSKLRQIFVGCADGSVVLLYDPRHSKNGALLIASNASQVDSLADILQTRADASGGVTGQVLTPFSLPMFREDHTSEKKRKREERKDPVKSKEPERPTSGKHKVGGQEGSNVTFAQFVADQRVVKSKAIAGEDPREALLRFGDGSGNADSGDAT